ncbi:hypothetical protein FACS1894204_13850 [Synergistales bacterium]|nr:hypothetical protein FACS1894204_13850 [Synergistales bacterium]
MIKLMNKVIAYLTIPLAVIVVYCALMRYIFHAMPDWGFEVSIFIFGLQVMLGGVYCHGRHKHVSVDIFPKYLSEPMQLRLKMTYEVVVLFVCLVIIYASFPWALDSFRIGERSMHQTTFNPLIWWFKAIIPAGSILVGIQAVVNFREIYGRLKTGEAA